MTKALFKLLNETIGENEERLTDSNKLPRDREGVLQRLYQGIGTIEATRFVVDISLAEILEVPDESL